MTAKNLAAIGRTVLVAAPLVFTMGLAACSNGNSDSGGGNTGVVPPPPPPPPPPSPTPTPTPSPSGRNVTACLNQVIPGTAGLVPGSAGLTPTSLIIPDTIKLNFNQPGGFPNGRQLTDRVVDITLAVIFLDVNAAGQSPATLANIPVNPGANDRPFLATFPYVAAPQGTPPIATGTGTSFNFRTDPASAFVRVDRNGGPAVAPALIGATRKNPYNDANLQDDINGTFVSGTDNIVDELTKLHNALADDLIALGLRVCST